MTRKTVTETRCVNGANCVAFPALGEPSKLSRGNPGPRCFACEERRAASKLKPTRPKKEEHVEPGKSNVARSGKSNRPEKPTQSDRAHDILERRRRSVLTCERGLRSALASGDERLVRRWSKSLREAKAGLAWAEADFERAHKETG